MYRVAASFYPCALILIHGTAVFGNPQPPPWPAIAACAAMAGRGGGILQVAATFPNNSTAPIQAFRLVALSPALSHGREDGEA
ncbi:hypothetical protein EGP25_10570, partial [Neisseria gonorrhoeae]